MMARRGLHGAGQRHRVGGTPLVERGHIVTLGRADPAVGAALGRRGAASAAPPPPPGTPPPAGPRSPSAITSRFGEPGPDGCRPLRAGRPRPGSQAAVGAGSGRSWRRVHLASQLGWQARVDRGTPDYVGSGPTVPSGRATGVAAHRPTARKRPGCGLQPPGRATRSAGCRPRAGGSSAAGPGAASGPGPSR